MTWTDQAKKFHKIRRDTQQTLNTLFDHAMVKHTNIESIQIKTDVSCTYLWIYQKLRKIVNYDK